MEKPSSKIPNDTHVTPPRSKKINRWNFMKKLNNNEKF